MARPLRIEYEGACYRVMNRADGRCRVSLRAFCLMPNPFHPYITAPEANLARFTPCALRGWSGPFAPGKRAMTLVSRCDPDPRSGGECVGL